MAATSSGKRLPSRTLVRNGTVSSRKHRFESFNQRVARLNIDPIRRRHRSTFNEDELTESASFFATSLLRWKNLNLSEHFSAFVREAEPLCQSLHQVVHHERRIFELLLEYVRKQDIPSLEPMLDLLSNFAHDMGVRFEPHFPRTVMLVASIAARNPNIEAIEWSFTCLAWLFKYLSRLLVPDLRPLFQIMAPLLGRESQKPHTLRFVAEAMSFLVRRAAISYEQDPTPLHNVVDAIYDGLAQDCENAGTGAKMVQYKYGLMFLLVNAIKGVDRDLHSCGIHVYQCLLDRVMKEGTREGLELQHVLNGTTVALVHHSDVKGFRPILQLFLDKTSQINSTSSHGSIMTLTSLGFLISTVRKGSRIGDWQEVIDAGLLILRSSDALDQARISSVFQMMALILQSAPYDVVIPGFRTAMETIAENRHEGNFLPFCIYFNQLGPERFQNLLTPYFSNFITTKWRTNTLPILLALPKIFDRTSPKKPNCPDGWQQHVIQLFRDIREHQEHNLECFQFLNNMGFMSVTTAFTSSIMSILVFHITLALHSLSESPIDTFMLGPALRAYVHHAPILEGQTKDWWSPICRAAKARGNHLPFLESVLAVTQSQDVQSSNGDAQILIKALVVNLHSSSHSLRKVSLNVIRNLISRHESDMTKILTTALSIEDSPLDLHSVRFISMQTRRLASEYTTAASDDRLGDAIPHFCFGMLSYKLSQACDDAVAALRVICESERGEHVVSKLCFDWLEQPSPTNCYDKAVQDEAATTMQCQFNEFNCSNLNRVNDLLSNCKNDVEDTERLLERDLDAIMSSEPQELAAAPGLALRVLTEIPHIAEKRSRELIPIFLEWASAEIADNDTDSSDESGTLMPDHESTPLRRWRQRDRRAMLILLGKFSNPPALYKADEVFAALKELLCNGDQGFQRLVLKAIFTWKLRELQPYQENLLNLLDDARFRDELTSFIGVGKEDNAIQDDHYGVMIPLLIRILYGRIITRSGTKSGKGGQFARRKAVLECISRLDDVYIADFVAISLRELQGIKLFDGVKINEARLLSKSVPLRRQLGILNMIKSMLEVFGNRLQFLAPDLIEGLMYSLILSVRQLLARKDFVLQNNQQTSDTSMLRVIRHTCIHLFDLMAQCFPPEVLQPYLPLLFSEVLSPRLESLSIETAQSVSVILKLFSTWASSATGVHFLVTYDSRTLRSITDCLITPSCQDEVRLFVLDNILSKVVECLRTLELEASLLPLSRKVSSIRHTVLQHNGEHMLNTLGLFLNSSPSKEALASGIRLVAMLAPLVEDSEQIRILLEVSTILLDQPSHRVSPKSKGELLEILEHFLPLANVTLSPELKNHIYQSVTSLFGYFKDRGNRLTLSRSFQALANVDSELERVAALCQSLNAYNARKVDEPDFDERLKAFNAVNGALSKSLSAKEWRPLLFNMLYYVKDEEELAIRSNASLALRLFVEQASTDAGKLELFALTQAVLLPSLRKGAAEASELVRAEYLNVMAHVIRHNPEWLEVKDMHPLLVVSDDEASFFANILHIQHHRRLRALRRLATEAKKGSLRSVNVAHFFIPLVEHFIFDKADDDSAHNLGAESIITIGELTSSMEWPQFKALFRRFSSYVQTKSELQKSIIKLLGVMIDALSRTASCQTTVFVSEGAGQDSAREEKHESQIMNMLAKTMPKLDKFASEVKNSLLPCLMAYLHDKDATDISLRVPVAISVTKLLKLTPNDAIKELLPPMLTDVCNMLRSRAQESRDLTRRTLAEISALIGPAYFGFVLKELRGALARGYQLHVLSFTVHSILVATSAIYKPGDLDYCLPQIVAVIMDDIFGPTGQEKDAEEYISKMKEVKSSKSFDSIELVAKTTAVEHLVHLIRPLQSLLAERLDLRMVRKIDELLRRIGVGLSRNEALEDQRILIFCHEIIRDFYSTGDANPKSDPKSVRDEHRSKRFVVNYHGANKTSMRDNIPSYTYKLNRFAFDVLRTVLHKHGSLQTPSKLYNFIPIIGDALLKSNEEIQTSALRLLTTIIKVPLKSLDDNAAVYVAECVKIVKTSTSTNVELAQAALKLVSAILRERRTVEIRDSDLAYLLNRLAPDLEQPDKQGIAFNLLKATMTRKIVIPEVYKLMDSISVIMVTNQTKSARDLARGAFFQFILDYPQTKDRLSKQVGFLIRNLEFTHQEGRQSVMEAVNLLFTKLGDDLVQKVLSDFFIPLVMVIVNDESSQCREMAGSLLRTLFERADTDRLQPFLILLRSWVSQTERPLLKRVAFQSYSIYFHTSNVNAEKEMRHVLPQLVHALKSNLKEPEEADWELLYFVLQNVAKVCEVLPATAFAASAAPLWASIRQSLSFPHAWVKLSAGKLLETYFADFARFNAGKESLALPIKGTGGLRLTEQEVIECTKEFLRNFSVPGVSEEVAAQSVRNLVFLGKAMKQSTMLWPHRKSETTPYEDYNSGEDSNGDEAFNKGPHQTALAHLISQSCIILRRPPVSTRAMSLIPLTSILQLLTVLTNHMSHSVLFPLLSDILLPLHNLTDSSIPTPFSTDPAFNEGYKSIVSNARELMSNLQEKVGTTEYVTVFSRVREKVKERRNSRRTKRVIEKVADPERTGLYKKRKGEKKREKRKERSGEERGRRRGW